MNTGQKFVSFSAFVWRCPVCGFQSCTVCEPCIFEGGDFEPNRKVKFLEGLERLQRVIPWRLRKHLPKPNGFAWRTKERFDPYVMAFVEICKVCGAHFISEDPRDMGRFICEDDVFEEPDRYPQGIERHDIFEHADKAPPLLPFLPVEPTKENAA